MRATNLDRKGENDERRDPQLWPCVCGLVLQPRRVRSFCIQFKFIIKADRSLEWPKHGWPQEALDYCCCRSRTSALNELGRRSFVQSGLFCRQPSCVSPHFRCSAAGPISATGGRTTRSPPYFIIFQTAGAQLRLQKHQTQADESYDHFV